MTLRIWRSLFEVFDNLSALVLRQVEWLNAATHALPSLRGFFTVFRGLKTLSMRHPSSGRVGRRRPGRGTQGHVLPLRCRPAKPHSQREWRGAMAAFLEPIPKLIPQLALGTLININHR